MSDLAARTAQPGHGSTSRPPVERARILERAMSEWERHGLVLILLACSSLRVFLSRDYDASLVVRDEGGYLANAAAFAGFAFDGANSYHAGYSLLILPAFLLFENPTAIYHCIQAINVMLAGLAILLVHRLLVDLFPAERPARRLLALAVAALYPVWMVLSSLAMSENAMVPSFCVAAWCCLQVGRRGGWFWIAWALACGWLFFVHPTAIASIAIAFVVAGAFAVQRREWAWFAAFIAACTFLVIAYSAWIQPWLVARLSVGSFPLNLHYPSWATALQPLLSLNGLVGFAQRLAGHAFYVLAGSLWLAWFAAVHVARVVFADARDRRVEAESGALAFIILAMLATLALSALTFTSLHAPRLDHWMYGRYIEGTMLPVLAIGFMVMSIGLDRTALAGLLVASACAVVLASGAPGAEINILNVTALWQSSLLRGASLPAWWLGGAAVSCLMLLLPGNLLRAGAIATVFLGSTWLVYDRFLGPCHEMYAERFQLAEFVREHVKPVPTCLGLDTVSVETPSTSIESWAKYGSHLFAYGMRRTTVEEWMETCDGPLISWSRDLDRRLPGVYLVASEKHDLVSSDPGPFLWMREPLAVPVTLEPGVNLVVSAGNRRLDSILGRGWYAPEEAGAWSGEIAELWLPVDPACSGQCSVRLLLQPLRASTDSPLEVEASVEGHSVARWRIDSGGQQWHSFSLPAPSGSSTDQRVRLDIRGAASPAKIGMSGDARTLGVKLYELAVVVSPADASGR